MNPRFQPCLLCDSLAVCHTLARSRNSAVGHVVWPIVWYFAEGRGLCKNIIAVQYSMLSQYFYSTTISQYTVKYGWYTKQLKLELQLFEEKTPAFEEYYSVIGHWAIFLFFTAVFQGILG